MEELPTRKWILNSRVNTYSAYPVSAEVYVSHLLNREEFQNHCDQYRTKEEILVNLM